MNLFLRVLLRNLSLGFGSALAVVLWIIVLLKAGDLLIWLGMPAGLVVILFLMSVAGSIAAVGFTIAEVIDRNLVSMDDINRLFGIPEKEKTKPRYF